MNRPPLCPAALGAVCAVDHSNEFRYYGGSSGGKPCAARARSQRSLRGPSTHDARNSRHGEGRCGWIAQRTRVPISPSSAAQRGGTFSVPRIALKNGVSFTLKSAGVGPPAAESASLQ